MQNNQKPPPPAVIGPPPRPNAAAYLPLLPENTINSRERANTVMLQQAFNEQVNNNYASTPRPKYSTNSVNLSVNNKKPVPPKRTKLSGEYPNSRPAVPQRAQSQRQFPSQNKEQTATTGFLLEQSQKCSSKYVDFSQWRDYCNPIFFKGIEFIAKHGVYVEGIFRVSGDFSKTNILINNSKSGTVDNIFNGLTHLDVFNVADFILKWCQETYNSLVDINIYRKLLENIDGDNFPKRTIKGLIYNMEKERFFTLMSLLQLCQLINEESHITKMNSTNLATCIAPSIIFDPTSCDMQLMQIEAKKCNKLVEYLIEEFPFILQDMKSNKFDELANRMQIELNGGDIDTIDRGRSYEDDRSSQRSRNPFTRLSKGRKKNRMRKSK